MPTTLFNPSDCLVTKLLAQFKEVSGHDLSDFTIVLPTHRLSTYFLANLTHAKGGAILSPRVFNFRGFIDDRISDSFQCDFSVLSAFRKKETVRHLIREGSYKILSESHVHELCQLIREFEIFEIDTENLLDLRDGLLNSFFREAMEDYQIEKLAETEQLLRSYKSHMKSRNWISEESYLGLKNKAFLETGTDFEKTFIVGLTTLSPSEYQCLETASRSAEVWLHDFREEVDAPLGEMARKLSHTDRIKVHTSTSKTLAVKTQHSEHQWQDILARCHELIANGVAPASIGILTADEASASLARREAIRDHGFEINCAVGIPFKLTEFGSFVSLFLEFLSTQDLLSSYSFLRHPSQPYTFEHSKWNAFLTNQVSNVSFLDLESLQPNLFEKLTSDFKQMRETSEILPILNDYFLKASATFLEGFEEKERQAVAVFSGLMKDILAHDLPIENPLSVLQEALESLEVRERGEPLSGLQILSIEEARSYPFQYVFLAETLEGVFPKKAPRDVVINEFLKRRLGLPGWKKLEAMEKVTFLSLVKRVPYSLLYYYEHEKSGLKKSKFIDLLEASKEVVHFESPYVVKTVKNKAWETQVAQDRFGLVGEVEAHLPHSATSFDRFVACPYAQLLHSLKVERSELPVDSADLRAEGIWLHAIVEGFFRSGVFNGVSIEDWPVGMDKIEFQAFAKERLGRLTNQIRIGFEPDPSLLTQLKQFSWPRLIEHLTRVLERSGFAQPSQRTREHAFQSSFLNLEFHGKIDAIENLGEAWLITDYKRKGLPDPKKVGQGLSSQLPVYLNALKMSEEFKGEDFVAGYWSIIKGEWTPGLVTSEFSSEAQKIGLSKRSTPNMDDCTTTLAEILEFRMQHIKESGTFAPDPSQCGHCDFSGICRKSDPQYSHPFENTARLEEYLNS